MFTEDADNEHDCGIMMAHYFFFLSIVNHCVFFGIAWIYAKVIKSEYVPRQYKKISYFDKATSIIFPILSWLAIRYKYHFKHLIATESIVTVISPITYLYDMVNPGTYTTGYIFALISVQWTFLPNRHLGYSLYSSMANNIDDIQCHRTWYKRWFDNAGFSKRQSWLVTSFDWYSIDGNHP